MQCNGIQFTAVNLSVLPCNAAEQPKKWMVNDITVKKHKSYSNYFYSSTTKCVDPNNFVTKNVL